LGLGKPGPLIGKLTALARKWQYAHAARMNAADGPSTEDGPPSELVEYLRERLKQMS
jgi:hypothetical protein